MAGFGLELATACRRLLVNKAVSAAAVVSLTICSGACIAAFRLIDALLLRPLPIAAPERLHVLAFRGAEQPTSAGPRDTWEYPLFGEMRAAVAGHGRLIAVSDSERVEIELQDGREFEKSQVQYVSGDMFEVFGLQPSVGRLLNRNDDLRPGAHAVAVLSHEFWSERFAQDTRVVGRTFRLTNNITGARVYQIIGVARSGFQGTEPGKRVDIFLPAAMHWSMGYPNWTIFRVFAHLNRGESGPSMQERLDAVVQAFDGSARARSRRVVELNPSVQGVSAIQKRYRTPLAVLSALGLAVFLIACANVANLMSAQAMARSHDLAIRVSLGATRWQLGRLLLMEGTLLGLLGAVGGWWFAQSAIPFVLSNLSPPDNPVRLSLAVDWRVAVFAAALTLAVPLLCAVPAALQASSTRPIESIKGGKDSRSHSRWMGTSVAVQAAFCFLALHRRDVPVQLPATDQPGHWVLAGADCRFRYRQSSEST